MAGHWQGQRQHHFLLRHPHGKNKSWYLSCFLIKKKRERERVLVPLITRQDHGNRACPGSQLSRTEEAENFSTLASVASPQVWLGQKSGEDELMTRTALIPSQLSGESLLGWTLLLLSLQRNWPKPHRSVANATCRCFVTVLNALLASPLSTWCKIPFSGNQSGTASDKQSADRWDSLRVLNGQPL